MFVYHRSSDSLTMEGGVAKHDFRGFAAFVIEMQIVLPRESDSAMYLNASIRDLSKRV